MTSLCCLFTSKDTHTSSSYGIDGDKHEGSFYLSANNVVDWQRDNMHSSLMSRIFPPSGPVLPRHEVRNDYVTHLTPQPPSIASMMSSEASESPAGSQRRLISAKRAFQSDALNNAVPHFMDPFLPIERAAKTLERNIQSCLDAQWEGLLAGMGTEPQDDLSSNGSMTPTPTISTLASMSQPKTLPVRQPQKKKVTLKGARRGLGKAMKHFATLKGEEAKILAVQEKGREHSLQDVAVYEHKRNVLSNHVSEIHNEVETQHASSLKADAEQLEFEIRRLEDEIAEKKARHRHLTNQTIQAENAVQSELSSYEASMKMLDSEIKAFLTRPPIEQSLPITRHGFASVDLYALKPERRTLEIAREHWLEEEVTLRQRKQEVESEKNALNAGVDMWTGICEDINAFENFFQSETSRTWSTQPNQRQNDMTEVLKRMDNLIDTLEQRFQFAEENGWNILIAAIGAELQAMRQGRELLGGSVQEDVADEDQDKPDEDLIQYGGAANGGVIHGSNESLKATLQAMNETKLEEKTLPAMKYHRARADTQESEDENPGPDFLISHDA